MKKERDRTFKIYIIPRTFTVRNAGGLPPSYIFDGKDAIGEEYNVTGYDAGDAYGWVMEQLGGRLTPEELAEWDVIAAGEVDGDGHWIEKYKGNNEEVFK